MSGETSTHQAAREELHPSQKLRTPFAEIYPFESHFLDVPGARMHFVDEGRGEPVVMVHGNPTWSFYYRGLVEALRGEYRTVVPDHIGC